MLCPTASSRYKAGDNMERRLKFTAAAAGIALLCCLAPDAEAQVTLEQCMRQARQNYPQIVQFGLIDEAEGYDLSNVSRSWLPQLSVTGKASYQSDVVEMPFDIPGFSFDLPHDQYSLVGELSQTIWDGGASRSQKELLSAGAEVQRNQLEVSLYAINDKVASIYAQLDQNGILAQSLERNLRQVQACIDNGTAYRADLDMVKVNLLDCRRQREGLLCDRAAYVAMLEKLTGTSLDGVEFAVPDLDSDALVPESVTRPELGLYDAQLEQNEAQLHQLDASLSPRFSLSVQAGVGRPGLNILENSFQPYYTAGIHMSWDIGALYTRRNDRRKIDTQMRTLESDRQAFLLNTELNAAQMKGEIDKARTLLDKDREIIALQESVRAAGEEQYRNGTISMTDLMKRIDDEYNARVSESIHEIQLLMAIYDLKNCMGYGE